MLTTRIKFFTFFAFKKQLSSLLVSIFVLFTLLSLIMSPFFRSSTVENNVELMNETVISSEIGDTDTFEDNVYIQDINILSTDDILSEPDISFYSFDMILAFISFMTVGASFKKLLNFSQNFHLSRRSYRACHFLSTLLISFLVVIIHVFLRISLSSNVNYEPFVYNLFGERSIILESLLIFFITLTFTSLSTMLAAGSYSLSKTVTILILFTPFFFNLFHFIPDILFVTPLRLIFTCLLGILVSQIINSLLFKNIQVKP